MTQYDEGVAEFVERVAPATRRRDAATMLMLMARVTGEPARLTGTIVGFGTYHYRYASGREGDGPAAAFSPRKSALAVYLPDGVGAHAALLERLGPHTTGVGCLYLKDLTRIDLNVLEQIIAKSYATLTSGTYTLRARESGDGASHEQVGVEHAGNALVGHRAMRSPCSGAPSAGRAGAVGGPVRSRTPPSGTAACLGAPPD